MPFTLPKLEYSYNSLEPVIDAKTMEIHHTKHHQVYIDKLNEALSKHPELEKQSVEQLLADINKIPEDIRTAVRNHGGGHLNHSLFWQILTPDAKAKEVKGKMIDEITKTFGSINKFKEQFNTAALGRFGSGWAWLVFNKGKLEITSTANQDSPLMEGKVPLLGVDVWEHAYYLKWQSNRKGYMENIWSVINWKKVNELFEQARKK
ncbi:superoxide dismutase [Candidatus Pacearchaeota archaeon]|nr:superoxide dismutase [Candidatus Pacearchaeota archaeon]